MGGNGGRREHIRRAVLDRLPVQGVGIVTAPGLRHIEAHAGIKPSAAAGTVFKEDLREAGCQLMQDTIESQHITVEELPRPIRRQGGGTGVCHMAVHVPLHIGHRISPKKSAQRIQHIVLHLPTGQIQDQLVSPQQRRIVREPGRPIGVCPHQIAVRGDHLRLKPDAQLDAVFPGAVQQGRQAIWEFLPVYRPVPQRALAVVPVTKPAVVQYHQLKAQRRRLLNHRKQLFL